MSLFFSGICLPFLSVIFLFSSTASSIFFNIRLVFSTDCCFPPHLLLLMFIVLPDVTCEADDLSETAPYDVILRTSVLMYGFMISISAMKDSGDGIDFLRLIEGSGVVWSDPFVRSAIRSREILDCGKSDGRVPICFWKAFERLPATYALSF